MFTPIKPVWLFSWNLSMSFLEQVKNFWLKYAEWLILFISSFNVSEEIRGGTCHNLDLLIILYKKGYLHK
jgi:hypothetical protein